MAGKTLSAAVLQDTLDAVRDHGGVSAAARALGVNRETMHSRWNRAQAWARRHGHDLPEVGNHAVVVPPSPRLPVTADEAWTLLDGWIGRRRITQTKPPIWQPGDVQRIVIAGDFHAPFQDNDVVATLIADEGPRADTLVISGDLIDHYSISRFIRYEHVPIEQEIAGADALLGQLAAAFSDVLVVEGNHDKPRFEKQLRTMLSPEMMHCIELLTGGNLSIVHLLAKRYPNVRFAPQAAGPYKLGWLTQVGDLVVSHAEKFSSVPGAALRKIEEGLTDFDHVYGLKPWRVLVQAHTHAHSVVCWHADRLLVEGGCCCITHGYQLTARMGGRPQRQGYVTLTQHKGATDLNSVRFRWLNPDRKVA